MRISDWSSDVCSSDLQGGRAVSRDTYFLDGSLVGSGTTTPTRINNRIYSPADGALRAYVGSRDAYNFAPDNYFQTPLERYNMFGAAQYEVADGIDRKITRLNSSH